MLKEGLDEYGLSDRMRDFDDNSVGGDNVKIEKTLQVKQEDVPVNDIKDSKQKVKEWLKTMSPKGTKLMKGKKMTFLSIYLTKRELSQWISHSLSFQSQQW